MTATDKTLYVRTNVDGQADVDFQLGTDRKQDVTISAVGQSKVVSAYSGTASPEINWLTLVVEVVKLPVALENMSCV